MPPPVPLPLRRLIRRRADRGDSAAAIAAALRLCPRTVRHLLQDWRQQPQRLEPAYRPGPGRPADHPLYAQALALRAQHPTWGAGYIRVRLAALADPAALPSERTLQRWFRRQDAPPAPPGRRPPAEAGRATAPHDTWQVDAVEQLRLGSGQGVCWLRLVDECSGAFLGTTVFPPLPLGPRRRGGRPRAAAGRLRPLGAAAPPARGQRQAVGVVE
jgi:Helix-turn-helix domain